MATAAALFDLSVYYFTHPSTSFKWEAMHSLHEEKENFVNLFTLNAYHQLPLLIDHSHILYEENVHYDSIVDDETRYP